MLFLGLFMHYFFFFLFFFFFKQKTAYEMRISDWSSDVCSSDLALARASGRAADRGAVPKRKRRRRLNALVASLNRFHAKPYPVQRDRAHRPPFHPRPCPPDDRGRSCHADTRPRPALVARRPPGRLSDDRHRRQHTPACARPVTPPPPKQN